MLPESIGIQVFFSFMLVLVCSTVFYLQLVFTHIETFPVDFTLTEFQLCILGLSNKLRNLLPTWPAS